MQGNLEHPFLPKTCLLNSGSRILVCIIGLIFIERFESTEISVWEFHFREGVIVIKQWNEQSLSEVSGGFWQTCTLHAAVKLDVFSFLGSDAKTAMDVSANCQSDLRGVKSLLNALTAMELLRKEEDLFSNTEAASLYLSRQSSLYIGWRILHHHYLMPSWARLDEAVLKGEPVGEENVTTRYENQREAFLMAMFNNATTASKKIVPFINLEGCETLLDLGGGPGTYSIQFCKKYSLLKAVVYDLPASAPYAEKTISRHQMQDRISFTGGDFFKDEIPGRYDAVWLSHILHSSGPEECRHLIGKAVRVLKPGGLLLVHDFWLNESGDGPLFPALFALNMLVRTHRGRSYTGSEVKLMLELSGLKNIRRLDLDVPNDSGVFVGEK